jgi:hypothetical protein
MNWLDIAKLGEGRTGRYSSWDTSGRNRDFWEIHPGESRVLADISGPGIVTHIWMTQQRGYRECLLKVYYDDANFPSIIVPLGDFFCLGHGIVNSFQSALFSASTAYNNQFEKGCALNCYVPMPFHRRIVIELCNEGKQVQRQYFYIDFERVQESVLEGLGYFHAEFRRTNPFRGWAPDIPVNTKSVDVVNKELQAWNNNYVILETKGRGHYIGCNLSVTNFHGSWWGEGDDMIWVDGYKWPPDLHGTGSEDYFNHAWGMQANAYLRNGSSIFEHNTGGYQTCYVFHLENPVRFTREIKVTIEHGHGNHLDNEMSSVAYWYSTEPTQVVSPPPVEQRMPVLRDNRGNWLFDEKNRCPGHKVQLTEEMQAVRKSLEK